MEAMRQSWSDDRLDFEQIDKRGVFRLDDGMARIEDSLARFSLTVVVAITVGFLGNITAIMFLAG